tara:strand:+ start:277 stop:477 length:201 start_codon:yes stop_codon:yes gene_type:complete
MATTYTFNSGDVQKSWTPLSGETAASYTFVTGVVAPTYSLDFLQFAGTWESLETFWNLYNFNWENI